MLGLLTSACPSGGHFTPEEQAELIEANGSCDATPIFATCGGDSCHGPGPRSGGGPLDGGIDLISPGLEERILGQPGSSDACKDDPSLLLDPTNVDQSLILTKLLSTQSCGDPMPVPNPPLALLDAEIACVRSWLLGVLREDAAGTDGGAP